MVTNKMREGRHKLIKKVKKTWGILIGLNLLDLFSTFLFLSVGVAEANPFIAWMLDHSFLFASAIKMLLFFAAAFLSIKYIEKRNPRTKSIRMHYNVQFFLFLVYSFVVLNNLLVYFQAIVS